MKYNEYKQKRQEVEKARAVEMEGQMSLLDFPEFTEGMS